MLDGVPGRPLLDTGVGETLIDLALAGPAGLELLGEEPIHFPSDPAGAIGHSLIASLALGPLVPARTDDRLDPLLFPDTGMSRTAAGFPLSNAGVAALEVALRIEGEGFGVDHSLAAPPLLCRSLEVAGLPREAMIGMRLPSFRLEWRCGFRIGRLLGDGFIHTAALTLDLDAMRRALQG